MQTVLTKIGNINLKKEAVEHYIEWLKENLDGYLREPQAREEIFEVVRPWRPWIEIPGYILKSGQPFRYEFAPEDFEGLEDTEEEI